MENILSPTAPPSNLASTDKIAVKSNIVNIDYQKIKDYFYAGNTRNLTRRREALKRLATNIKKNESLIFDALKKDLNKSDFEAYAMELALVLEEINYTCDHLNEWVRPKSIATPLTQFYSTGKIYAEPYGVALIISPWNYPFMLTLTPLIGAIAGGNCAVIKPSEFAPHTANIVKKIIEATFISDWVSVQLGDAIVNQTLLKLPFDKIFFTGSPRVGRIVMESAIERLASVTLELGGKSPCIVDTSAELSVAAARITWGKFANCGQTCIAPDHIWVHESQFEALVKEIITQINTFYGSNPQESPDLGRIINDIHFERIRSYFQDGKILFGGNSDAKDRYIQPTLLHVTDLSKNVMQDEIFGPILPIITYKDISEVRMYLQKQPAPLALYIFTKNKEVEKMFIQGIAFGGGCVNDCLVHLSTPELPFGGVGNSGMGNYHGKASFDAFTYSKSILKKTFFPEVKLRYPPYKGKLSLIKKLM